MSGPVARDVIARAVVEVARSGDVAALDRWVAADLVDHRPGAPAGDLAGMKASIAELHAAVDVLDVHVADVLQDGDRVLVRWRLSARPRAGAAGERATVAICGMTLMRFEGDRVVERWVNRNEES